MLGVGGLHVASGTRSSLNRDRWRSEHRGSDPYVALGVRYRAADFVGNGPHGERPARLL